MKFGRLLASSRSVMDGNVAGRYQLSKGFALPQFISPKNPFQRAAAAGMAATATRPFAESMRPGPATAAAKLAAARPGIGSALRKRLAGWREKCLALWRQFEWSKPLARVRMMLRLAGAGLKRAGLFCLDHNPFSAIGRPKLPGIPRFGRAVKQGELALDRVHVVRNDLTDADLEVIRVGVGRE